MSLLQVNQAFHCNRCRLQFVFLKDKMQHKLENHRSFRRPPQLEGLPPGSKVSPALTTHAPAAASSLTPPSTGDHQDLPEGEAPGDPPAAEPLLLLHSANQHKDGAADVPGPGQPWKVQTAALAPQKAAEPPSPSQQVRSGGGGGEGRSTVTDTCDFLLQDFLL